jgi:hypothetical protein
MSLAPEVDGSVAMRSSPGQFVQAFRHRVETGLLLGPPHPRSKYEVVHADPECLRIRAANWRTALTVGLNDVELRLTQPGCVNFRVRYWRWAAYALGLSGVLGLIALVLLLTVDVRGYIAGQPGARLPGLSIEQNLLIAWGMVLFWGFVWPWLLIVLHKRSLRRLLARLIGEVDAQASHAAR